MARCAYPNCKRPAAYDMGWMDMERNMQHGMVCPTHDRILGRKNLMRNANMTVQEAIAFEQELKRTEVEKCNIIS